MKKIHTQKLWLKNKIKVYYRYLFWLHGACFIQQCFDANYDLFKGKGFGSGSARIRIMGDLLGGSRR